MPHPDPVVISDYTVTPYGNPDTTGRFRWRLVGPGKQGGITASFGHASRAEVRDRAHAWLVEQGLISEVLSGTDTSAPAGKCWIVGCGKNAKARRLCHAHYGATKSDGTFEQFAAPANPASVAGGKARQAMARAKPAPETSDEAIASLLSADRSEASRLRDAIREATGLLSHVRLDEEPEDNAAGLVPRIREALAIGAAAARRADVAERNARDANEDRADLRRSLDVAERGAETLAALYALLRVSDDAALLAAVRALVAPADQTAVGWDAFADALEDRAAVARLRAAKLARAAVLEAEAAALRAEAMAA